MTALDMPLAAPVDLDVIEQLRERAQTLTHAISFALPVLERAAADTGDELLAAVIVDLRAAVTDGGTT